MGLPGMFQSQYPVGSVEQHPHHSIPPPSHTHQDMRGRCLCLGSCPTPMIQGVLSLLPQQHNTQTLTTRSWTTWAGWTGRTPSGTTSTPPGLDKLLQHPILGVQIPRATHPQQTNTREVTTPVQISWVAGSITTYLELLSTPELPGPRALSWTGSLSGTMGRSQTILEM